MVVVTKKKGETKEAAFRKFTKAFIEENIVEEIRSRMFYKKPSILKKEEKKMRRKKPRPRFGPRTGPGSRTNSTNRSK